MRSEAGRMPKQRGGTGLRTRTNPREGGNPGWDAPCTPPIYSILYPSAASLLDCTAYPTREKEAALEVRAMLVASGCSDAQIDAATAAAHGDVNAAAERLLYDSSM